MMNTEELWTGARIFFEQAGGTNAEKQAVANYLQTGKNFAVVQKNCPNKDVEYKTLAALLKPFLSALTTQPQDSAPFKCAYRFFQYACEKLSFTVKGNFDEIICAFMECGLTFKEAMLLDVVITDFTKQPAYKAYVYQVSVFQNLRKKNEKLYRTFRDELYTVTEAEATLSPRTRDYYAAMFYGALQTVMENRELDDGKDVMAWCDRFERIAGKRRIKEVNWYYFSSVAHLVKRYAERLLKKEGRHFNTPVRDRQDVSVRKLVETYAYFEGPFKSDAAFCPALRIWFTEILNDRQMLSDVLGADESEAYDTDSLVTYTLHYLQRHPDDYEIAMQGVFQAPSKKIVTACAKTVENKIEDIQELFNEWLLKVPNPEKDNETAIRSIAAKLADVTDDRTFADVDDVEAFAKGCKLSGVTMLSKFDLSTPVYDRTGSKRVSEHCLKVFLDRYFTMKEVYRNRKCDKMAAQFDTVSFRRFLDRLFETWQNSDYDNKLKAAVVPYAFYTSNQNLLKLKKLCEKFCDNGRHQLAASVISIIAMNGGKYALMLVDGIANKFPYPKAKQAAAQAMAVAAERYKIPVDVLADMIIPDCGFGYDGTRAFTCGDETLTLQLMPGGDVAIFRGEKKLKALPEQGEAGKEAKKDFSDLKKELKTLFKLQTVRLERACLMGRCWTFGDFKKNYFDNPAMRLLCATLVWGVYDKSGALLQSFRICEDGSKLDYDYNDVEIADSAVVALVHACDLDAKQTQKWQAYLADNEIQQPFVQFCGVCFPDKESGKTKEISYAKYKLNMSHAMKIVNKYNMVRLPVEDGGSFGGWYLEDGTADYGFELLMDDLYVGCEFDYGCNMAVRFYTPSENKLEYWSHTENGALNPLAVPTRIVSSVMTAIVAVFPDIRQTSEGKAVKMPFKPFIHKNEMQFEEPEIITPTAQTPYGAKGRSAAMPAEAQTDVAAANDQKKDVAETDAQTEASANAATEAPKQDGKSVSAVSDNAAVQAQGETVYLEFVEGTSAKFWQAQADGCTLKVTFGRIGTNGSVSEKQFDTPQKAQKEAEKLIASKTNKGYVRK